MKLKGQILEQPKPETVVIPRGEDTKYIFTIQPVLNYSEFDAICPEPKPPTITYKDGRKVEDIYDKDYLKKRTDWALARTAWVVIKSLSATEGLEWETVDIKDPSTYTNYLDELKQVLSTVEINYLLDRIFTLSGLNEDRIKEATESFLAGQG